MKKLIKKGVTEKVDFLKRSSFFRFTAEILRDPVLHKWIHALFWMVIGLVISYTIYFTLNIFDPNLTLYAYDGANTLNISQRPIEEFSKSSVTNKTFQHTTY